MLTIFRLFNTILRRFNSFHHTFVEAYNQVPNTSANGIQVKEQATVPLFFGRIFGRIFGMSSVNLAATAGRAGGRRGAAPAQRGVHSRYDGIDERQ
jgi:hypothetical protein